MNSNTRMPTLCLERTEKLDCFLSVRSSLFTTVRSVQKIPKQNNLVYFHSFVKNNTSKIKLNVIKYWKNTNRII